MDSITPDNSDSTDYIENEKKSNENISRDCFVPKNFLKLSYSLKTAFSKVNFNKIEQIDYSSIRVNSKESLTPRTEFFKSRSAKNLSNSNSFIDVNNNQHQHQTENLSHRNTFRQYDPGDDDEETQDDAISKETFKKIKPPSKYPSKPSKESESYDRGKNTSEIDIILNQNYNLDDEINPNDKNNDSDQYNTPGKINNKQLSDKKIISSNHEVYKNSEYDNVELKNQYDKENEKNNKSFTDNEKYSEMDIQDIQKKDISNKKPKLPPKLNLNKLASNVSENPNLKALIAKSIKSKIKEEKKKLEEDEGSKSSAFKRRSYGRERQYSSRKRDSCQLSHRESEIELDEEHLKNINNLADRMQEEDQELVAEPQVGMGDFIDELGPINLRKIDFDEFDKPDLEDVTKNPFVISKEIENDKVENDDLKNLNVGTETKKAKENKEKMVSIAIETDGEYSTQDSQNEKSVGMELLGVDSIPYVIHKGKKFYLDPKMFNTNDELPLKIEQPYMKQLDLQQPQPNQSQETKPKEYYSNYFEDNYLSVDPNLNEVRTEELLQGPQKSVSKKKYKKMNPDDEETGYQIYDSSVLMEDEFDRETCDPDPDANIDLLTLDEDEDHKMLNHSMEKIKLNEDKSSLESDNLNPVNMEILPADNKASLNDTYLTSKTKQAIFVRPFLEEDLIGFNNLASTHIENLKFFKPTVPEGTTYCTIERERGFFGTTYKLYYSKNKHFLLCAQKCTLNSTNYYIISSKYDDYSKGPGYLGKVRSNFEGNKWVFYSEGADPTKAGPEEKVREELGAVLYNNLDKSQPMGIQVGIPYTTYSGRIPFVPHNKRVKLQDNLEGNDTARMFSFKNKMPYFDEYARRYLLDFKGRVKLASVKNFQLVLDSKGIKYDEVLLQFGKVEENSFNIDFRYPLSYFQAFCICLTSFDNKMNF